MRKAIMSLVVVCALTSLAMAVATGPGGTLYFSGGSGGQQVIWAVNVDSDWNAVDTAGNALPTGVGGIGTTGACTQLDSITLNTAYSNDVEFLPNAQGNMDMGGLYSNATLLLYYENSSTTCYDHVKRAPDGTLTTLVTGLTTGIPNTARGEWHAVIDSNFTPNGALDGEWALANAYIGTDNAAIWTDSDGDGTYTGVATTGAPHSYGYGDPDYCSSTGAIASASGGTGPWSEAYTRNIRVTYKDAVGTGYTEVVMWNDDPNQGHTLDVNVGGRMEIADTDGNGVTDFYWMPSTTSIAHGQDANGDGDCWDAGEAWNSGLNQRWTDYVLIQTAPADATYLGGHWALVGWVSVSYGDPDRYLMVYDLDEFGDATGTPERIVRHELSPEPEEGDPSLKAMYDAGCRVMNFQPLGESGTVIPEPATMLLVGTGVLGLAGVVRRRLLG